MPIYNPARPPRQGPALGASEASYQVLDEGPAEQPREEEAAEPAAAAPAAGAQQAPVERQDSRQGKQRLAKTNSSGSGGQSQGDNRAVRAQEPVRQGPGSGQQRPAHKRTEGPKSPVTSAK